jgi:putative transposase
MNKLDQTPGRKVWFQYWETHLTCERSFYARLRYVHKNAVHHGLVNNAALYPWCSAGWFEQKATPSFRSRILALATDRISVPDDFEVHMDW